MWSNYDLFKYTKVAMVLLFRIKNMLQNEKERSYYETKTKNVLRMHATKCCFADGNDSCSFVIVGRNG